MRSAALVLLALVAAARAEDPPAKDDAARRAAVAKLGRLAWSDVKKPPAFCDLDGGSVVESDAQAVSFLKWLPDGKRVVACGGERLFVIDAATGRSTNLTPGYEHYDALLSPRVSTDGSQVVVWREDKRFYSEERPRAYAVFDLVAATCSEIAPAVHEDWLGAPPPCWFAPDGTIVAVVGATPDLPETLARFDATGKRLAEIAAAPADGKIRQVALSGDQLAFTIERRGNVEVRDATGAVLFAKDCNGKPTLLRWEEDGAALRLDVLGYGWSPSIRRRIAPAAGKPVEVSELSKIERPRFPAADGTWLLEQRREKDAEATLVRVDPPDMELVLGPGASPNRLPGDVFVFWRVTVPNRPDPRAPSKTIQGTDDLWAYDPKDGAVFRMTDRGFTARCWDVFTPPPASRTR